MFHLDVYVFVSPFHALFYGFSLLVKCITKSKKNNQTKISHFSYLLSVVTGFNKAGNWNWELKSGFNLSEDAIHPCFYSQGIYHKVRESFKQESSLVPKPFMQILNKHSLCLFLEHLG